MKPIAILLAAAGLALSAGCTTTPADPNTCTGYERGRLNGLKTGAKIVTPSQTVQAEIAALEAKCGTN